MMRLPEKIKKAVCATGIALALLAPIVSQEKAPPAHFSRTAYEAPRPQVQSQPIGYCFVGLPSGIGLYNFAAIAGRIKSLQQISVAIGSGATSNTGTISSVTVANTAIDWSGYTDGNTSTWGAATNIPSIVLTNSTTITVTRTTSESFALTVYISVIEWQSTAVRSVQYGSQLMNTTGTTATFTISSITTTNSTSLYNGQTCTASSSSQAIWANVQIAGTTSVTIHRDTGSATVTTTVYFCILEWASGVLNSSTQQCVNSFTGTSATTTITAVTLAQVAVFWGGHTNTTSGSSLGGQVNAQITATTTVTFQKSTGTFTTEGCCTVVEFKAADINSVNRGTNAIATSTSSKSTTITAVVLAKTIVHQQGYICSNAAIAADLFCGTTPASTTSMQTLRVSSSASNTTTAAWEAVEFK